MDLVTGYGRITVNYEVGRMRTNANVEQFKTAVPYFHVLRCAFLESLSRRRDSRLRFASVLSCGLTSLMHAIYWILSRRPYDWRRDARRRIDMFSCAFPRLMYDSYGILSRCWDDKRHDARRRFASVLWLL
jgi:hypothetical protein